MASCHRCGAGLVELAEFCHRCGHAVEDRDTLVLGELQPISVDVAPWAVSRRWVVVLLVLAAVVGAAALLSTTGDSGGRDEVAPTTTVRVEDTRVAVPSSMRVGETIELPPVPAPVLDRLTGSTVVLASTTGELMLLDLDSGHVEMTDGGHRVETMIGLGDRLLALSLGSAQAWIVTDHGLGPDVFDGTTPARQDLSTAIFGADRDSFWLLGGNERFPPHQVHRVSYDGSGEEATLLLPAEAFALGVTPDGSAIVTSPAGGVYVLSAGDLPRRASSAAPIATAGDLVLVNGCDARLECSLALVDVMSGEAVPVPGELGSEVRDSFVQMSPDGSHIVQSPFVGTVGSDARVVSLRDPSQSCEIVPLPQFGEVVWAPDSGFVAFERLGSSTASTTVTLVDVTTCAEVEIELPFPRRGDVSIAVVETAGLDG